MIEDRHIQWLLERCVPGSCPLEWVVPLPNAEALNCDFVEEPTVEGIAELISTAISQGLVRLYRSSIRDERQTSLAWPVTDPRWGEIALGLLHRFAVLAGNANGAVFPEGFAGRMASKRASVERR